MTIAAYKRKAAGDITTQELQHYETNVGGGGGGGEKKKKNLKEKYSIKNL